MNELLFVHRSQSGSDLRHNFQRHLHFDPTRASDEMLEGLSLDRRALPVAMIPALYRVPPQILQILLSPPKPSFSGD